MATEAQIRANQENAQKSKGPTSIEGKKKSSMNAVTHGIFSNIAILPGEDEAFIHRLREDILATPAPRYDGKVFSRSHLYRHGETSSSLSGRSFEA